MTTRAPLLLGAALSAILIALGSGPARANGVFPSAEQIVVDPSDPSHVVVRTTYGLLTTRAAGDPWDWICETAVGYSSGYHPSIALAEGGAVLAGLTDGVAISGGETCAWGLAPGVPVGARVVDLSVEKGAPSRVVAITASNAAGPARLWESIDGGATWAQAGAPLPAGFTPLTVDVAPSDPMRVYVSARVSTKGALLVSLDRGQTWQSFTVPAASAEDQPYIGAVDPVDADRVYIRTDGVPGRLLVFDHATVTFTEIFLGAGLLRGFALSPDGQTVLVGGGSDGVQRAPVATFTFEKVSSVQTRCLAWTSAGVYTCASQFPDGFTIGLSMDEGATFEPVLTQPCVRGPLECDPATAAGAACPSEWPAVAIQIETKECTGGGGGAATTGAGGAGGEATGAGGAGAATGGGGAGGDAPGAGCACAIPGARDRDARAIAASGGSSPRPRDRDAPAIAASGGSSPRDTSVLAWVSGLAALTVLFRRGRRRATPAVSKLRFERCARRSAATAGAACSRGASAPHPSRAMRGAHDRVTR